MRECVVGYLRAGYNIVRTEAERSMFSIDVVDVYFDHEPFQTTTDDSGGSKDDNDVYDPHPHHKKKTEIIT